MVDAELSQFSFAGSMDKGQVLRSSSGYKFGEARWIMDGWMGRYSINH